MKFVKLDITKHDLDKISRWIYETELAIFRTLIGKDEIEAQKNIKTLIKSKNNIFSYENIYVVTDENEEVLGILVAFTGNDISFWGDFKAYYNILDSSAFLKYVIKGTTINELLTTSVGKNDYYLSNIAVDPHFRGQGIGSFILQNAFQIARDKGCNRVLLDVTFKNKRAMKLYERFGFKVNGKNVSRWIWKDEGTYGMEYVL